MTGLYDSCISIMQLTQCQYSNQCSGASVSFWFWLCIPKCSPVLARQRFRHDLHFRDSNKLRINIVNRSETSFSLQ